MYILFADKLMDNRLIQALSWTLIHSLWQGMLAAIIAGIIILTTKKATALLRYNLLSGLFAALILSTIITFGFEYASAFSNQTNVNNVVNTIPINDLDHSSYTQNEEPISYLTLFKNYFNNNAPLIVLLWFLFFMVQSIRLFAGLHYIHRIRFNKISDPDDVWKDKLQALCRQLGIQQKLLFLQSQIIKTPVVIGYFKPTILVPLGLLTNLPADQVETILLHELAHIRRKDYLVNLLQSFAEAVFFFNPAIIWISSLIREEREACCDDIVMNNTVNKGSYLEALVSFHQHTNTKNTYALALNGQNSFFIQSCKAYDYLRKQKTKYYGKTFFIVGCGCF